MSIVKNALCFNYILTLKNNLLFQIANHSGYVQVDWKKVEKDVNKAKKHLKKKANNAPPELNSIVEEVGIA